MRFKNRPTHLGIVLTLALAAANCGCGSSSASPPPPPIGVSLSQTAATLSADATAQFTATVSNDSASKGVTWTVACSAAACGSVSPAATLSGAATTYTAPATAPPRLLPVTITAISVADTTKTASGRDNVLAQSSNVVVSCPGQSLSAAVAALPPGPNTVTVTGTCVNENVVIHNMRSLSIIAGAAGAKIVQAQDSDTFDISLSQDIHLQGLEIAGVPGSTLGSGGTGVSISEASDVHIDGCNIHDSEGDGIFESGGSQLFLSNSNIHNNPLFGSGMEVFGSNANVSGTTIQNNGSPGAVTGHGIGIEIARGSVVVFSQMNLIQNNGDIGITAGLLSTVAFAGGSGTGTTVQGHNIVGINISEGAHLQDNGPLLVQGNGVACPPGVPIPCGGIAGTKNSTLEMSAGTISGNHGAGIVLEQGANLDLTAQFGGVTVSNNTGDGVQIRLNSIGDFRPLGSSTNTITGNGGASISCDNRSLAVGNLTGFTNVNCAQTVPN